MIPKAVNELLRYAFEDLGRTTVWCGYYDGNEKSKRAQEKCGFIYSHTEDNKPVPLMNEFRTEHFTKITLEDWKNNIGNLKYMIRINLIMMLLPVVFMVHEYEKIIMFRCWIDRNKEELRKRLPKIELFFT